MGKIRLGILGTSEIAFRRFMPALQKCDDFEYAGVASRTLDKTNAFVQQYGGIGFDGYQSLIECEDIDAVYIPLPPALHYEWGRKALEHGKHVFMEKPFTTSVEETAELLSLAEEKGLAVHENYMFLYHSQLAWIKEQISAGVLGEVRLIRTAFGFPFRGTNDFRYDKSLGGGALLDCGGYPVRLALDLLGETVQVTTSHLGSSKGLDVDVYGSATLENEVGQVAQISFGMDNSYKCELEIWGSEGCLMAPRIFTAPENMKPIIKIASKDGEQQLELPADDSFFNSIKMFQQAIQKKSVNRAIYHQSNLIQQIKGGHGA